MLRPFVTYEELKAVHPSYGWIWDSIAPPTAEQAIRAASFALYNDLRRKGVDDARIYIPLTFDDDKPGQQHTRIASYTSDGVAPNSERRFVVEVTAGAGEFALEGLVNDEGTEIWADIESLSGSTTTVTAGDVGTYSVLFFPRYSEYRYTVVPDGTITYSCYLVDDAVDELLYTGALIKLLEGRAGQDEAVGNAYQEQVRNYENALARLVADYADSEGVIEPDGLAVNSVRVTR